MALRGPCGAGIAVHALALRAEKKAGKMGEEGAKGVGEGYAAVP